MVTAKFIQILYSEPCQTSKMNPLQKKFKAESR